jgi:hypothetical protein
MCSWSLYNSYTECNPNQQICYTYIDKLVHIIQIDFYLSGITLSSFPWGHEFNYLVIHIFFVRGILFRRSWAIMLVARVSGWANLWDFGGPCGGWVNVLAGGPCEAARPTFGVLAARVAAGPMWTCRGSTCRWGGAWHVAQRGSH